MLDILWHGTGKGQRRHSWYRRWGSPIHPFWYKNRYPEKQIEGLPFSSFGIGGIFLHSSHHFIDDQKLWKRESQRGHRKAWIPYHESKKNKSRFDGPTHTHKRILPSPHALIWLMLLEFFKPRVIIYCVRWYSAFPLKYILVLLLIGWVALPFTLIYRWKFLSQLHLIIWSCFLQATPHFPLCPLY